MAGLSLSMLSMATSSPDAMAPLSGLGGESHCEGSDPHLLQGTPGCT
jgi:hypothetical protein